MQKCNLCGALLAWLARSAHSESDSKGNPVINSHRCRRCRDLQGRVPVQVNLGPGLLLSRLNAMAKSVSPKRTSRQLPCGVQAENRRLTALDMVGITRLR